MASILSSSENDSLSIIIFYGSGKVLKKYNFEPQIFAASKAVSYKSSYRFFSIISKCWSTFKYEQW